MLLYTLASVKLKIFAMHAEKHYCTGTGYLINYEGSIYLITNWHNATGLDYFTKKPIEPLIEPDRFVFEIYFQNQYSSGVHHTSSAWYIYGLDLYDDERNPTWRQIVDINNQVCADIVAFPLNLSFLEPSLDKVTTWGAFPFDLIEYDTIFYPSDKISVIGYPAGLNAGGKNGTPQAFWKTGFIASEMYQSVWEAPSEASMFGVFFIDAITGPGMSGSPVIGIKDGKLRLLGTYSGRYNAKLHNYIGIVWSSLLLKILILPDYTLNDAIREFESRKRFRQGKK